MVKKSVFALGWRPLGSSERRWQVRDCVDVAEAARLVAALVRFDGGGRWRVYDMVTVPTEGGSVKLVRRSVVAGRCRPSGRSGDPSAGFRRGSRPVRSLRSRRRLLVARVSVYRVGAVGADPVHVFGGEAHDFDLRHAAWLGWLPLDVVAFAGPGVALAGDTWLTVPLGRSEGPRHVVAGDFVTAQDAAGELIARGECGLTAYTNSPGDVSSDGPLWASSVAVLVADDVAVYVDRLRSAHAALAECVDGAEQERAVLDACQSGPSDDSPVLRRCGRAVRDLQEQQSRLHGLLEAVVRIGVFDPAVALR